MNPATILVTGSSSGLGRRTAETLARRGHTVFASMRAISGKNAGVAGELRSLARAEGLALDVIELDVTDDVSVQNAVQTIVARTGSIDVVVNNAGFGVMGITEATSIEQTKQQFDVNFYGVLRVNQAVLPHMRRQRAGLIVYTASMASRISFPMLAMYSATKAALDAMARTFAYDLQEFGIDTTIIHAGGFSSEFGHNITRSANGKVWSAYGATGEFATAFVDSMETIFEPGALSHPQLFADLVADLVAMPQGARPLRVPIGMGTDGLELVNQALDAIERQALRAFGLEQFITSAPAASRATAPEAERLDRAA